MNDFQNLDSLVTAVVLFVLSVTMLIITVKREGELTGMSRKIVKIVKMALFLVSLLLLVLIGVLGGNLY